MIYIKAGGMHNHNLYRPIQGVNNKGGNCGSMDIIPGV